MIMQLLRTYTTVKAKVYRVFLINLHLIMNRISFKVFFKYSRILKNGKNTEVRSKYFSQHSLSRIQFSQEWSAMKKIRSAQRKKFLQNLAKKSQKYCEPNKRILWDQGFVPHQFLNLQLTTVRIPHMLTPRKTKKQKLPAQSLLVSGLSLW